MFCTNMGATKLGNVEFLLNFKANFKLWLDFGGGMVYTIWYIGILGLKATYACPVEEF